MNLKLSTPILILFCGLAQTGCFQWTEDPQGHMASVGVPGAAQPIWQSQSYKDSPGYLTPTAMGMSAEDAAKVSGPVMVIPATPPATVYRYQYYYTGHNRCQEDVQKALAERSASGATGPEPYCTETPTGPPSGGTGTFFIF